MASGSGPERGNADAPLVRRPISRREFLRLAGVAGAGFGLAGGLGTFAAACGEEEETTTTTAGATTTTAGGTTTTAAAVTTTVKPAEKILKVGCVMPFSGGYDFGIAMKPSIDAYAELLNEAGGVVIGSDTYKVEMRYPDDAGDPKRTNVVAQELIDWGAVANVGAFTQGTPFAVALTPHKIIDIGQMDPSMTIKDMPYFIGSQCNNGNITYGYQLYADICESKKFGIIIIDFLKEMADRVVERLKTGYHGNWPDSRFVTGEAEIVDTLVITAGSQDFASPLSKMADAGVDTLVVQVGAADFALSAKQARTLGHTFNMMGAEPTALLDFIELCGSENAQGLYMQKALPWEFKNPPVDADLVEMAHKISARVEEKTGIPEAQQYTNGYSWGILGLRMLLDFYQQAGSIDPDEFMATAIGGTTHEFTGVSTMGGTKEWGDTARIKPGHNMLTRVAGDTTEYAGEIHMPTEW